MAGEAPANIAKALESGHKSAIEIASIDDSHDELWACASTALDAKASRQLEHGARAYS